MKDLNKFFKEGHVYYVDLVDSYIDIFLVNRIFKTSDDMEILYVDGHGDSDTDIISFSDMEYGHRRGFLSDSEELTGELIKSGEHNKSIKILLKSIFKLNDKISSS